MKKVSSFLFNRATIVGLSILLQVSWLVLLLYQFSLNYSVFNWILRIVAVVVVLVVSNKWSNPSYKLSWTVVILTLPITGLVLYYIFGRSGLTRKTERKLERVNQEVSAFIRQDPIVLEELQKKDQSVATQAKYIMDWAKAPLYRHTDTQYFASGEEMFPYMKQAIREAKEYIFLEYFILSEGQLLTELLDELETKTKEGVEVRLIYDDFGCVASLPTDFERQLEERGIAYGIFNTIRPVLSVFMNNRDHRKICVIDGKIGFTGGINLADEYINVEERFGYWKDTGIRLEGDAVYHMTAVFLEMWNYIKGTSEDYARYLKKALEWEHSDRTDGFVQPYTDSPLDHENIGKNIYMNLINRAKQYVYIFTPYLIIDNEMMVALSNAAKSGVDVRIVTPGIPDKKLIFLLSQSYYKQLLENGIRIYQFTPGFLHAKTFLCDDEIATVGSINLDYRSLYLHFENGVWMYQSKAVAQVKSDMLQTLEQSEEVTEAFCKSRSIFVRILQSVFRMFAPLL